MQAHVAKESKSKGSTDRMEFRMSKVRGFFCFEKGADERRPLMAKVKWWGIVGGGGGGSQGPG